ncbi:hypothetical protein [Enterobacter kobei]|uniref:hypothetical protein n=1 Tax=Enterobacter kobei TaxID=208224 RepID=UPI003CF0E685
MNRGNVKPSERRAIIVASGPSASNFSPPPDTTIIAVNGAIEWLSHADYFFTLDPSAANLKRLAHRRSGVRYCVAGFQAEDAQIFERVCRTNKPEPTETFSPEWWMWRLKAVPGLCTTPGKIHTGNSAWGALGLAYHLGFNHVALTGVDATDEPRIEGGNSKCLSHLPLLFASARPQINVVSLGKLNSVPQYTLHDWLEMSAPT